MDIKFRFKTKEEFIQEYGGNWRYSVPCSFMVNMDIYLGKAYTMSVDDFKSLQTKNVFYFEGKRWSISKEMLVIGYSFLSFYYKFKFLWQNTE